jgi:hypothetical protein
MLATNRMGRSLVSGVAAGFGGLLIFLVVHHVWIAPIWFIAPVGLVIASLGGLAIGWSYFHLRPSLPARPFAGLAMFALVALLLLPGMLLSFSHGPLFDLKTGRVAEGMRAIVIAHFVFELVLTASVAGALAGYALRRTRAAALSTAVAGVAWALGPGHNIPMFGTNPAAFKGHAIVLLVAFVACVTLVETAALVEKR